MSEVADDAIRRAIRSAAPGLAIVLAACSAAHDDEKPARKVVVVSAPTPTFSPRSAVAAKVPVPSPSSDAVKVPTSLSQMRPHKNFTDPPLPPELRDDHGLIPLPPPSR